MSSKGGTGDKFLDDSLTNIQWLCELESSELLLSKKTPKSKDPTQETSTPPQSPNPYSRPAYSYATLILLAINSSEEKRMTLQKIYKWIEEHYPYYTRCKKAWKNSIRHNLSLHSFFLKEKRPVELPGKGSYWSISPEGKENIMREVMKHAQPIVQTTFGLNGLGSRNLRPILPKPLDNMQNNTGVMMPKLSGVCSLVNGGTVMPVVILPTNVYISLASKIANNGIATARVAALGSTVISADGNTVKSEVSQSSTETRDSVSDQSDLSSNDSTTMNALMNEILNDKNFSEVLDSLKEESDAEPQSANAVDSQRDEQQEGDNKQVLSNSPVRKNTNSDFDLGPSAPKRIKKDKMKVSLCMKLPFKRITPTHSSRARRSQSPLRDRMLPTLAAINYQNNDSLVSPGKDFKFQDLSQLMLSPVQLHSSKESGFTTTNTSTPTCSSPLTSATFHSGLTPLKYDSDSGFFTPLKDSEFEFLLSPSQFGLGLTPAKSAGSNPQRCRKSLRLGTQQEGNENDSMPAWMHI